MENLFDGWSDGEVVFFLLLIVGLLGSLMVAIGLAVRNWLERRRERAWESRPLPELVVLAPPAPPAPETLEDRLVAIGFVEARIEDIKYPPPRLACTIAFVCREGGCCYCDDGTLIQLFEIGVDCAAWPLMTFCACGCYQLKEPHESELLGARLQWFDDVIEMVEDLEEYGPGSLDEARYRLLFARRNVLQAQVDVLTTAIISLEVSVARRRREYAWREKTAA